MVKSQIFPKVLLTLSTFNVVLGRFMSSVGVKGLIMMCNLLSYCRSSQTDTGDLSLFEALRESIYSEVASLISKNEDRPHFLIELFQELQLLNSDYLRQRALFSIKDVVSRFLTENNSPATQTVSFCLFLKNFFNNGANFKKCNGKSVFYAFEG